MLVGIRKSPCLPVLRAVVKLRAGVTPKHTPMLQNASKKQNIKYLEIELGKLTPVGCKTEVSKT